MSRLPGRVDEKAAETGFAGVVRLERSGAVELDAAYGLADRAHGIPMTTDTRLGMASTMSGGDAGVPFWSCHHPVRGTTATVIGNTMGGAWPVAEVIESVTAG